MKNRWQTAAFAAILVILAVFTYDLAGNVSWSEGLLPGARVVALIAAVAFAGATYIYWESAPVRDPALNGAAALGLLGGALAVSSVFSAGPDVVFRDVLLASIGMVSMTLSYVLLSVSQEKAE